MRTNVAANGNSLSADERLSRFNGVRPKGDGQWDARCPVHEDRRASLSIGTGRDGALLLKCHAGCSTDDVLDSVGLTLADLFPATNCNGHHGNGHARRNGNRRGKIVAEYDYRDEFGELLFQVCRMEPKDFLQRKPDGNGGWTWSTKGVRRVLYRLPELLAADPSESVFIVEGEKDADRLSSMGIVATCNAGGAGKWRREFADCLEGRHVAVVADNDAAGMKHATNVARSIHGTAASVKLIELPGIGPRKGFDVSDWLGVDGRASDLLTLAEESDEWEPSADDSPGADESEPDDENTSAKFSPVIRCFADIEARPVSWLWHDRIATGRITLLVGRPGLGKSFLTCDIASRISTATPWPDGKPCERGSTLFITAEDGAEDTIRPRLDAHRADVSHVHEMNMLRQTNADGETEEMFFQLQHVAELEAAIQSIPDLKLVVVDPVGSFIGGRTDAHRDNEVRSVLAPVAKLAERYGVAVLAVLHNRKGASTNADDSALGSRAFVALARSVWHLLEDKDDKNRRLLLPGKNNLAATQPGLAFTIAGAPGAVHWERDPVSIHADEVVIAAAQHSRPGPDAEAASEAEEFLRDVLSTGPRLATELVEEAKEGHGISRRTLDRAKKKAGVKSYRNENPGPWYWRLDHIANQTASSPKGKELGDLGNVPQNPKETGLFDDAEDHIAKLSESGSVVDDAHESTGGNAR